MTAPGEVAVRVVDWLPRLGRDWLLYEDAHVLAVAPVLVEQKRLTRLLGRLGLRVAQDAPPLPRLGVRCPTCGRVDVPQTSRRPTVDELGLLPRRRAPRG